MAALPFCRVRLTATLRPTGYPKEFRHLGDHIRARRLDLGLQIKQLADPFKTDEGSVAAWESGSRQPSLYKLPGLLAFLFGLISEQMTPQVSAEPRDRPAACWAMNNQ